MADQLMEAGILLGVGMLVVFSFLIMLIGGIQCIAWFERRYPSPNEESLSSQKQFKQNNNKNSPTTDIAPDIVAAISGALHMHRQSGHQNKK
ncbi:OadG family protein [Ningiella sp. W23]|uniref:OadG family protein n=1 Tax=Ningiella sp. W23 TaxID=3023715 RepID=UPI003756B2DF